jgi:transcriptional regulator with XRE-family HTH domain
MNATELQQELFQEIKRNIPGHLSATEEIAKVLNVSVDSVYRRMRAEKSISLDELYLLCTHYKISLDRLMNIQTGGFLFSGKLLNSNTFRFDEYLSNTIRDMTYVNSFKQKEFYTLCKDIHIFHHYHFREIAAFKYYFWMKTLLHFPDFKSKKFSFSEYNNNLFELGKKTLDLYNRTDSVELWNIETINSTIRQIEFYHEGQMFDSNNDVLIIYEALDKLIAHLETQAALGYKFDYDDPEKKPKGSFQMYFNEVILGDNTTLAILDGAKIAYLIHTVVNYIVTRDISYCENLYEHVQNLMRRSTRISSVGEKERSKFFRILKEKIARRKDALKL